ncbi:MAG: hypothetical protein HYS89_00785 [Candidatus Colwellbacteria bacterium]|nr:hypothetical protein [Candidatus Colwellbacteria bacterium]
MGAPWLELIQRELEEMSEENLIEPDTEVEDGDHVVGRLSDLDLKKLYTLGIRRDQDGFENFVAANRSTDKAERERLTQRAARLRRESRLILGVFRLSIDAAFELWATPSVSIRKDWTVVWSEPEPKAESGPIPIVVGIPFPFQTQSPDGPKTTDDAGHPGQYL